MTVHPAAVEPDPTATSDLTETVTEVATGATSALVVTLAIAAGVLLAILATSLFGAVTRAAGRRWSGTDDLIHRSRNPVRFLLAVLGAWIAVRVTTEPSSWTPGFEQGVTIALIIAAAWLLVSVARVVEGQVLAKFPVDVPDNRHARRIRTQVQVLRRLVAAVIVILAGAAILFTFPGMRTVGASILASAGLVSIVAGLAAQTSLANVFAGMQIAFTDAIRVDDVVIVEGEWGRIEEITMTYVVVQIWDDRRLVLPSTYFTTTPFQNWTRRASQLLGTIELDVDWSVPLDGVREEMHRLLEATDLWDQRVAVVQVTDATGGHVRLRALTSAASAPILWDLRCYLREGLVTYLQEQRTGLPRTRFQPVPGEAALPVARAGATSEAPVAEAHEPPEAAPAAAAPRRRPPRGADDTGVFTGTAMAEARQQSFAGPVREVIEEREQVAEERGAAATQLMPRVRPAGEAGGTHGDDA